MEKFDINGVRLRIPGRCLTPPLVKALESGQYERSESAALQRHLQVGDRVLDLGAGAGYLSILAAQVVGGANVTSVEASPAMQKALRRNLNRNDAGAATLLHGAVVGDDHSEDTVQFVVRNAFWASSIPAGTGAPASKLKSVPALRFSELINAVRPSVVCMDIEGAEAALCQHDWPDCVRLLIMEIHTRVYPPSMVQKMFDGLSRTGLTYMPWGSRGEVVVFQRVETRAG